MIYIKQPKGYNRKSLIRLFINEKPATYSDPECENIQCEAGRYRSVTEILEIVKVHFPKTTLEDILKIIRDLIQEDNQIALIWCTQVKKVVLKYTTNQHKEFVTRYSVDRYNNKTGVDGYSINDYLQIINNI